MAMALLNPRSRTTCDSSVEIGNELPYHINGTYICGVNPYTDHAVLQKCCAGPITNITSPAHTSGTFSDSWPVTCLAYCAIMLKPKHDGNEDAQAHSNFLTCLADANVTQTVCTMVDGFAPKECIPFQKSVGCTDSFSHKTWDGSTYVSGAASTTAASTGTTTASSENIASSETTSRIVTPPIRASAGTTTTAASSSDETGTPSPSPTKSAARQVKPLGPSSIIVAMLVLQVLVFAPLL